MGFRSVEPEPDPPTPRATPAVPMRLVLFGTAVVVGFTLLPVVALFAATMTTVVARSWDVHDHDRVVERVLRDMDQDQLQPVRRVYPDYPELATDLGLPAQRCLAEVFMDEQGTPYDVEVDGCPAVFVQPTRDAMMKWRWNPPMHEASRRLRAPPSPSPTR